MLCSLNADIEIILIGTNTGQGDLIFIKCGNCLGNSSSLLANISNLSANCSTYCCPSRSAKSKANAASNRALRFFTSVRWSDGEGFGERVRGGGIQLFGASRRRSCV